MSTATNKPFRLKRLRPNARGLGMEFNFSYYLGGQPGGCDPIVAQVFNRGFGSEWNQDRLFSYCFLRFGEPQVDPEMELDERRAWGVYRFATPDPRLTLEVRPLIKDLKVGGFRFFVPMTALIEVNKHDQKPIALWRERAIAWAEAHWRPSFTKGLVQSHNRHFLALCPEAPKAHRWSDVLFLTYPMGQPGEPLHELTTRAIEIDRQLRLDYEKVEPYPVLQTRSFGMYGWPEDDPLKPLAVAADLALRDFYSPVRLYRRTFSAFGPVLNRGKTVKPSAWASA